MRIMRNPSWVSFPLKLPSAMLRERATRLCHAQQMRKRAAIPSWVFRAHPTRDLTRTNHLVHLREMERRSRRMSALADLNGSNSTSALASRRKRTNLVGMESPSKLSLSSRL